MHQKVCKLKQNKSRLIQKTCQGFMQTRYQRFRRPRGIQRTRTTKTPLFSLVIRMITKFKANLEEGGTAKYSRRRIC